MKIAFFLKVYRKIDLGPNPDVEISRYLKKLNFENTPPYISDLTWDAGGDKYVLASVEEMIENHGNGYTFMIERLNNYIERILARDRRSVSHYTKLGSLTDPVNFEELPDELKEFLGGSAAEFAKQAGNRTAKLHNLLADGSEKEFQPEDFSLHYQRSLFSSMQSLVRETFQNFERFKKSLPESSIDDLQKLYNSRSELLELLKKIYSKKFDVAKTRVHGFFGLHEILLTGKDVMIHNYNGNPFRSFSERRLKRSPLRDVAALIRSVYYVAYHGFYKNPQIRQEEMQDLLPYADFWAFYVSSIFMRSYYDTIDNHQVIPSNPEDMKILMDSFIIENALHYLNYEIVNNPEWAHVPAKIISSILHGRPQ